MGVGGGNRTSRVPRISTEHILNAYRAGPEAILSLFEYLQDEYQATAEGWAETHEQLLESIKKLEARIEILEENNNKDSHNSNKPPSSDGFTKRIHSRRKPSGKKSGGQEGHEGTTLRMVKHPQHIQVHSVIRCCGCGESLKNEKVKGYDRRQVFDLPPVAVEVTEHRAEIKRCPSCREVSIAAFPEGVTHKTQYGNQLRAWASYFRNYGLLPYERCAELFRDLFGVAISEGTLVNIDRRCSEALTDTVETIRQQIGASAVICCDETGININGKLAWLHTAGTESLTYYAPHPKRGIEATDEMGILPEFRGVAVHDGWRSYLKYSCGHALCNAHHIRELTFIVEQYSQNWAQKMINLLLEAKEAVEKAKEKGRRRVSKEKVEEIEGWYTQIVAEGMRANPPPENISSPARRGRRKRSKARNLLERLERYRTETLRFLHDFRVPFENNLAERDLRMMKVQQKISGTFRSLGGAVAFCRIRSYISTVKKQELGVIDSISSVFEGRPALSLCRQTT